MIVKRQFMVEKVLRWERFVENVGFKPGVKEGWMTRVMMMTEMG